MLLTYLIVFLIGGTICSLGQVLVIKTKMTTARILVSFVYIGVFLEAIGVYEMLSGFAKAGINVPIIGFGASMCRGAIEGAMASGIIGVFSGGLVKVAAGVAAAVIFAFVFALIFKSKSKK